VLDDRHSSADWQHCRSRHHQGRLSLEACRSLRWLLLLDRRVMLTTLDTGEGALFGELYWLLARIHNADNGTSSTMNQVSIGKKNTISIRNVPFYLRPRSLQTPVSTVSTIASYDNLHVKYLHLSDVYTQLAWATSNAPSNRAAIPGFFVSTV
jgi:hypothetical protein